jgi:cell wall-associated NlpC family hydrolase
MPRLRSVLVLALLLALAGSAAQARAASALPRRAAAPLGRRVSAYAERFLGVPYRWGGESPRTGFDCSGFVAYVFRHFGVVLPHYTGAQFELGLHVRRRALEPGDLVFFDRVGHVGVYLGGGRFVHAPHAGSRVRVDSLFAAVYATRFSGARRVLRVAQ